MIELVKKVTGPVLTEMESSVTWQQHRGEGQRYVFAFASLTSEQRRGELRGEEVVRHGDDLEGECPEATDHELVGVSARRASQQTPRETMSDRRYTTDDTGLRRPHTAVSVWFWVLSGMGWVWTWSVSPLTNAVPAAAFPVVAPVQYRPPTTKRITHTSVWHVLMMVRRPSLSVDSDQRITARRLQQLQRGVRVSICWLRLQRFQCSEESRS
jgi:hypothetical protein